MVKKLSQIALSTSVFITASSAFAMSCRDLVHKIAYPAVSRGNHTETKFGVQINDPYRHLEVPGPERDAFIAQQNKLSSELLPAALRAAVEKEVKALSVGATPAPLLLNGTYYSVSKGSLYSGPNALTQADLLVDVPALIGNPKASLTDVQASPDGKLLSLVYGVYGADFPAGLIIFDVASKKVIETPLAGDLTNYTAQNWIRGPFWMPDSKSLVYTKVERSKDHLKIPVKSSIWMHTVGADPASDKLLFEYHKSRPGFEMWYGRPTQDGKHIVIQTQSSEQEPTIAAVLRLGDQKNVLDWIRKGKGHHLVYLGENEGSLFFRSGKNAKNLKISKYVLSELKEGRSNEITVVPETSHPIQIAMQTGNKIIVVYTNPQQKQANTAVVYDTDGKWLGNLAVPGEGSIDSFKLSADKSQLFFHYNDYFQARLLYSADLATLKVTALHVPQMPFARSDFKIETKVLKGANGEPDLHYTILSPIHLADDASAPLLEYLYGNVAAVISPFYSPKYIAWMKQPGGARVVIAHVQGGPEKGRDWVDAGRALNKEGTFEDTIRLTEHLISEGLTKPHQVMLEGRSSGGFNVLAIANRRPDLFGVVASIVPLAHMTDYPRFAWGHRWLYEYGSPTRERDFRNLLQNDPYHNVKYGEVMPPTVIFAGGKDDRVDVAPALKIAAAKQYAAAGSASANPVLLFTDVNGAHAARSETVDQLTFAFWQMGIPYGN